MSLPFSYTIRFSPDSEPSSGNPSPDNSSEAPHHGSPLLDPPVVRQPHEPVSPRPYYEPPVPPRRSLLLDPPVEEEPPKKDMRRVRWWKIMMYIFVMFVIVGLLGMLVDRIVMPWYVKLGAVEVVPNVVGMTYVDAEKKLKKMGFEVKRGEPRFDEHFPAGIVVVQLPFGGTQTKQGRRVYLTVSRGAETIPVPDFVGMPLREARISAMRIGLEIGEATYEYNDTIMKDLVCAQSIPPTMGARGGTVINIVISRGSHTAYTMMPNLISLGLDDAKTRLENAGLKVGNIEFRDDALFISNTVIDQSVPPYARVVQGASIELVVAQNGASPPDTTKKLP